MQDDDGVPLDAALDALASPAELAAIAAWRALGAADLAGLDALDGAARLIPPAFRQLAARVRERQEFEAATNPLAKSPEEVRQLQGAAKAVLEPLARQLTAELRAGRRALTYRPRDAGAERLEVPQPQWADLEVVLLPHGLSAIVGIAPPTAERPGRARPPAWLLREGHRTGGFRVHAACPIGTPKAAPKQAPSQWNQTREAAAAGSLIRKLANADDAARKGVGKKGWKAQVEVEFPDMPGEAWEARIWRKAVGKYPELSEPGRKPRPKPTADAP